MPQPPYGEAGQNGWFQARIRPTPTTTPGSAAGSSASASMTAAPGTWRPATHQAASRPAAPAASAVPVASSRLVDSACQASPRARNSAAKLASVRLSGARPAETWRVRAAASIDASGAATAISATAANRPSTGQRQAPSRPRASGAGLPVVVSKPRPATSARCTA
ncbi:Uncharacterised protein [Achromobacter xylosoxidans]|nr:Uncharacterised protein [Achromobacter xylosoxidans]